MNRIVGLTNLFCLLALLFLLSPVSGVAVAQPSVRIAQSEPSPESRSQVFEAIEGMQVEEVSGAKLLLAAYALFWLLLFAYVVRLARIQARTHNDLARLERLLAKSEKSDSSDDGPVP